MLPPSAYESNGALLAIECGMTAIATATAFTWPRLGASWFACIERLFAQLARRRGLSVAVAGLSVLVLRLALLPIYPIPIPFVTDDFSFLLAGDTFALGRLTNPTPAMWQHFESIHITMVPTYMSMYFPGQGLILAAGKVLLGNPWYGVLIVSALMCAALCWMLQAWLPPNWALLGGLMAVLRLGVFSCWTNTYHAAGSLAALGGALVLGALPRLLKTGRMSYALLLATGAAILALTRAYEGLLLCLPAAFVLGRWLINGKNRPSLGVLARRAVLPLVVLITAGSWLAYYDYRAFGSPTTLPYTIDRNTYAITPYFIWQHERPTPAYRHEVMRQFYTDTEYAFFKKLHSWAGFVPQTLIKIQFSAQFYISFSLLPPLIMLRRAWKDRRIRFMVITIEVMVAGLLIEIYLLPHYVAPFTAAFYVIGLQAMRHLRVWEPEGKPAGLALARMTILVCVLMAGLRVFAKPLRIAPPEIPVNNWNCTWFGPGIYGQERAAFKSQLEQMPGGQLVIVRYGSKHNTLNEWVYNDPDIDDSKVVWAREMDAEDNLKLIHYYANRKVWLAEPDTTPARLLPYPMPGEAQAPVHSQAH
jgi:hypothetical protein